MEYWLRRGPLDYSFDVPDEAKFSELKPALSRNAELEARLEEVRETLLKSDCVILDYLPFHEAYKDLLSGIRALPKVYLSAWRYGEGLEGDLIKELERRELDIGFVPLSEAKYVELDGIEVIEDAISGEKVTYVYPATPSAVLPEDPRALLPFLFTKSGKAEEALLSKISNVTCIGLIFGVDGRLVDVLTGDGNDEVYDVKTEGGLDCVIVSAGGAPLDDTLYLSLNAALLAAPIVKKGGTVILTAECSKGVGSPHLLKFALDFTITETELERTTPYERYASTLVKRLSEAKERMRFYIVSVLPKSYVEGVFGLKLFDSAQEAMQQAVRLHSRTLSVCAIPYGNMTRPIIG